MASDAATTTRRGDDTTRRGDDTTRRGDDTTRRGAIMASDAATTC